MSQTELMHGIAAMQNFDGAFNLDAKLCSALNVNHSSAMRRKSNLICAFSYF